MPLIHHRVIEKHTQHIEPITTVCTEILSTWSSNLSRGVYNSETQNDGEFIQRILVDVLGYVGSSDGKNWTVAKNQPVGKGNVDVALGNFSADSINIIAPFELKGAKTKDLDAVMAGRNKTPVQQAWEYGMDAKGARWVIVSNYREIRLYAVGYGRKDYEAFDLTKLFEPKRYARFMLLLSAENLLSGKTSSLLRESEQVDKEITDQLYADYKALRSNLIHTIGQDNPSQTPLELIRSTQTILDRILFIAFAEDKGLLPENTLKLAYEDRGTFNPRPVWENFQGLFHAINKGNDSLKIPAYNGGLFAPNPDLDQLSISDELCEGFKKIGDYDFDSDVSVNILGHIFEQSISDLEELKAHAEGIAKTDKKQSKRKKDGIYYTPPYVTRYIVEQTVGCWLEDRKKELRFDELPALTEDDYDSINVIAKGKRKGQITYNKNIEKHIGVWEAYKSILSDIKVLDPACGSGAFLNEVFDYLKKEGQVINNQLSDLKGGQTTVFRWDTHILASNLFGVDLNSESVEITKLSLWLKTASRQESLTYLEDNIKVGNSLIDDRGIAGDLAFNWQKEFISIMAEGGFDVVVGNPPYGAVLNASELAFLEEKYECFEYQANTYVLFYEKGVRLLKSSGILGYITPATFTYQHYFQKVRGLFSTLKIRSIAKYNYAVFEDADIGDTVSWVIEKSDPDGSPINVLICANKDQALLDHDEITTEAFTGEDGTYKFMSGGIPERIFNNPTLGEITNIVVGIKAYQTGKGKPKQTKDIVSEKPFTAFIDVDDSHIKCVIGRDFHRYGFIKEPNMRLKYGEWLAEPRPNAPFFDDEKIIVRQTADKIIGHLDTSKAINLNNVYNVGSLSSDYSLKYILALLNSRLVNRIYQDTAQEKGKLFAEVKKVYLKKIPIVSIELEKQKPLIDLVEEMLSNNVELFNVINSFQRLLDSEFIIKKKTGKIEKWVEEDFSEFCKELEKQIKPIKLTLSQKSEWMMYFEEEKAKASVMKNKINQINREIDQLVYGLYELTPEEIDMVEQEQLQG